MLHEKIFIDIGFVRKAHRYRGYVKIGIENGFRRDLMKEDFIFMDIEGYMLPFFLEDVVENGDVLIKLEGVDNPEEVKKYQLKRLFLLEESIKFGKAFLKNREAVHEYTGWEIRDTHSGWVGIISRVEEYPKQSMAIVKNPNGGEFLIPLHDDLILEIRNKILTMNLPKGLVS